MREPFASRYDVIAKAEHEVPREQLLVMLQTLLVDRFKLSLHRESRVESVYKLVIANGGPKLLASKETQTRDPGCTLPHCMSFNKTDMWSVAAALAGRMGRPVLDLTGLQGSYDFTLRLDITEGLANDDPEPNTKSSDWSFSSIFTDIEKELGLKLESAQAPVETLVIDHAERLTSGGFIRDDRRLMRTSMRGWMPNHDMRPVLAAGHDVRRVSLVAV